MILTHKRMTVAAVAAMTALAAGLVLYVSLFSSPAPAYALEQTVQANDHIMSCHIKITPAPRDGMSEAWVQFGPDGTPIRARVDYANTRYGPYVFIMSGEKLDCWCKAKHALSVMPVNDSLKQLATQREQFDPKLAFEKLQAAEKAGTMQMTTQEPSQDGQPITLTVTWKDSPDARKTFEVNPKTKLVERMIEYCHRGDKWEQVSQLEYLDYNKEIDPRTFKLDLPEGILTMDSFNQEVGLAKGDLSDKEIAVKVVREYWEAMIARDYAKASKMYSGLSPAVLAQGEGYYYCSRIVSIGEPKPDPAHGSILYVPVKVEWETTKPRPPQIWSTSPCVQITDAEMATKAVRQFYEALIAKDYEKATRISEEAGLVDENFSETEMKNLKKMYEDDFAKVSRIVEIGKPVPHPKNGSTEVPIKIEIEYTTKMGKSVNEYSPMVCPVGGQSGRWAICGGI